MTSTKTLLKTSTLYKNSHLFENVEKHDCSSKSRVPLPIGIVCYRLVYWRKIKISSNSTEIIEAVNKT